MATLQPYRLTVLLHPQSSPAERTALEDLVKSWVRDHQGEVRALTLEEKEKGKLAYAIRHQAAAPRLHAAFTAPPAGVRGLADRLRLEQRVLRARLWRGEVPLGKRLKDLPPRKPETGSRRLEAGDRKPDLKAAPAKEKVSLEKLEEKIEEILKEEVL